MQALTLRDLVLIAVLFVTVIGGFYLVKVLKYTGSILLSLKKILDDNNDNINSVIKDLPKMTEKAAEISSDAQVIVAAFKEEQIIIDGAIQDVSETIGAVSATAQAINEDVFSKVKALFNALTMVVNMIVKKSGIKESDLSENNQSADSLSDKEKIVKEGKKKRKRIKKQSLRMKKREEILTTAEIRRRDNIRGK